MLKESDTQDWIGGTKERERRIEVASRALNYRKAI